MAESLPDPVPGAKADGPTPEALLREGSREAGVVLGALEEAAVRERRAIEALSEELGGSLRDLQYERKWRGQDQLLTLASLLAARSKEAVKGLGVLLDQVVACQRLTDRQAELLEPLSLLETEVAPYAHAITAADSAFDPTTPYGAFVPALRLFTSEMAAVGKEFTARPVPEDFVEASMYRKYQAALGRLAPLAQAPASSDYATLHEQLSSARERLMQGVVLARARADRDAAVLKSVERVKADLASEFERVETLFAELDAAKTGPNRPSSALPPSPQAEPAPTPAEARRRGLFGRLRK